MADRVARYWFDSQVGRVPSLIYSPRPHTVSGRFCLLCFRRVQWGEHENDSIDICYISLFWLPCLPPHRRYATPVSSSSSSCCFCPCNSYLFLFSTYAVLLAGFLVFFLHRILQNSFRLFCFVLFCFCFLPFLFFFYSFVWPGFFWCVFVTGTLAVHLTYLDALRLYGLLCLTAICNDRICTSLG